MQPCAPGHEECQWLYLSIGLLLAVGEAALIALGWRRAHSPRGLSWRYLALLVVVGLVLCLGVFEAWLVLSWSGSCCPPEPPPAIPPAFSTP